MPIRQNRQGEFQNGGAVAHRRLGGWLLALAVILIGPGAAWADDARVWLVLSKERGAHRQVTDTIMTALARRNAGAEMQTAVLTLEELAERFEDGDIAEPPDLIVTVGTEAARRSIELRHAAPVLHTLVPHAAFDEIVQGGGEQPVRRRHTAIFLDQPIARQLDLIRVAMPARKRVAVVLGPTSQSQKPELQQAAGQKSFNVNAATVASVEQLLPTLNRLLEENDVLLSMADPLVFNSNTIHHLLLSTYRQRIPVVGLSAAYVKAGALIAVYSTPEQIGKQAYEMIREMEQSRFQTVPKPRYPKYFSIAINRRVADSLGLHLETEAVLLLKLQTSRGK